METSARSGMRWTSAGRLATVRPAAGIDAEAERARRIGGHAELFELFAQSPTT